MKTSVYHGRLFLCLKQLFNNVQIKVAVCVKEGLTDYLMSLLNRKTEDQKQNTQKGPIEIKRLTRQYMSKMTLKRHPKKSHPTTTTTKTLRPIK